TALTNVLEHNEFTKLAVHWSRKMRLSKVGRHFAKPIRML
ncbi:MAG: hypothetical protein ACI9UN_001878, partial [Granulosicoccus sp.]